MGRRSASDERVLSAACCLFPADLGIYFRFENLHSTRIQLCVSHSTEMGNLLPRGPWTALSWFGWCVCLCAMRPLPVAVSITTSNFHSSGRRRFKGVRIGLWRRPHLVPVASRSTVHPGRDWWRCTLHVGCPRSQSVLLLRPNDECVVWRVGP